MLKRCVYALRDATSQANQKRRQKLRVPFYDSMLTQLLEPALGGPSRTVILVGASQEPEHAEETVGTLRFGEAVRLVERSGETDNVSKAVRVAVAAIDAEVKEIEVLIKEKEHWVTRTTKKKVRWCTIGRAVGGRRSGGAAVRWCGRDCTVVLWWAPLCSLAPVVCAMVWVIHPSI